MGIYIPSDHLGLRETNVYALEASCLLRLVRPIEYDFDLSDMFRCCLGFLRKTPVLPLSSSMLVFHDCMQPFLPAEIRIAMILSRPPLRAEVYPNKHRSLDAGRLPCKTISDSVYGSRATRI
jgi:hypothetical protein